MGNSAGNLLSSLSYLTPKSAARAKASTQRRAKKYLTSVNMMKMKEWTAVRSVVERYEYHCESLRLIGKVGGTFEP
jgi:hypothetical protein